MKENSSYSTKRMKNSEKFTLHVAEYISEYAMISEGDNVIIGYSGGADSGCLLFLLSDLRKRNLIPRCELYAVHVNHGIRGDEAERDEKFTRDMCAELGINYVSYRIDVPRLSKDISRSEEETGRIERYRLFRKTAEEVSHGNRYKIAVAHNANDRAETYIFNLSRGAGLKGLSSIKAVNGEIIRPIMCLERKDIEKYCEDKGISYVNDSTNEKNDYTRNYIRNNILSDMEKRLNKNVVRHINEAADAAKEAYDFIDNEVMKAYDKYVSTEKVREQMKYLISYEARNLEQIIRKGIYVKTVRELTGESKDLYRDRIEATDDLLISPTTGKLIELGNNVSCKCEYKNLVFFIDDKMDFEINSNANETFIITEEIKKKLDFGEIVEEDNKSFKIKLGSSKTFIKNSDENCTKYFDYDKIMCTISEGLCLRRTQPDDYMVINKNGGKKRLKNILKDRKIPAERRKDIWVLAAGNKCLWAVGVRRSVDFMVENGNKDGLDGDTVLCVEVQLK